MLLEGTIELWSEQGKGSEFHVILDFGRAKEKETDMKLPGWRILVLDDNEELCASTVANLEELRAASCFSLLCVRKTAGSGGL